MNWLIAIGYITGAAFAGGFIGWSYATRVNNRERMVQAYNFHTAVQDVSAFITGWI